METTVTIRTAIGSNSFNRESIMELLRQLLADVSVAKAYLRKLH